MPKRKTTEEFIAEARKVHGDKYDYSKVEYINKNTKVCIICSKHGEFWQDPHSHLQGSGCPLCCIDKRHGMKKYKNLQDIIDIVQQRGYTTLKDLRDDDTNLYAFIKRHKLQDLLPLKRQKVKNGTYNFDYVCTLLGECETKRDLREKYPLVYAWVQQHGLLDDLYSKKYLTPLGNHTRRCVYSYTVHVNDIGYVYVGLTYDVKRRHKQHIENRNGTDSLANFCECHSIEVPEFVQETDYIDSIEAAKMEGEILKKYVVMGFKPINKAKTGSLGAIHKKEYTYEECKKYAQQYKTLTEWQKSHSASYEYARKHKWLNNIANEVFEIPNKNKFHESVTTEMLIEDLQKYDGNVTLWKQHNVKYAKIAQRYGHMEKIRQVFPTRNQPKSVQQIDINNGKIINTFNSIREAARHIGATNSNIKAVINGKNKTCKGYYWKLIDD